MSRTPAGSSETVVSGLDIASQIDPEYAAEFRRLPVLRLDESDLEGAVAALRASVAERQRLVPPAPVPQGVASEDRMAPGLDGAPDVMVRLYRPTTLRGLAPVLYWIHGGGMVLGSVQSSDAYCGYLAKCLGAVVASVEYRLAPEHPYPAALDDCYAGLWWLTSTANELGVDRSRLAIGGGSAGGGLAAGLALRARDNAEVDVCFQLLVYPMLDDRNTTPSSYAIIDPRVWNRTANLAGWNAYLPGQAGSGGVSPYAAPARSIDLSGLPPAHISVGTLDLFVDEDVGYAEALLRSRVSVELHVYPGAFHGSQNIVPEAALSKRWLADERAALARAFSSGR